MSDAPKFDRERTDMKITYLGTRDTHAAILEYVGPDGVTRTIEREVHRIEDVVALREDLTVEAEAKFAELVAGN